MAALALALAASATAEADVTNPADTSLVRDLDEMIVVSQPKEQYRMRQQPVSSSMFSGRQVEALGASDLRELSAFVPNFTMPVYGSRYTSSMYVRGIGSRVSSPAVGIYVDGVPLMSKSAFNHHFYNLLRVDVLRGPQATLYGLNSEGGLVRLYTRDPMAYQGTDLKVGVGSHLRRNAEVAHYHKVNSQWAYSVEGFYDGQNGFYKNPTTGERADRSNEAGGRLKLVWQPSERWDVRYVADYQYVRQNAFPYGLLDDAGHTAPPNTNRQSNYRRNLLTTSLSVGFKANAFDLTSTTSYQYVKDYMLMDIDYLPADFLRMEERQFQNAMTQEIALKSRRPVADRWRWTLGAFGGFTWLKTGSLVHFDPGMDTFLGNTVQGAMYNAMVSSMAGRFMANGMTADAATAMAKATIERAGGVSVSADMRDVPGSYHTPTYNLGVFHESNIVVTPRLTATVGLRYDWSKVAISYDTHAAMQMLVSVMGREMGATISSALRDERHNQWGKLLPKVGLTYRLDEEGSNVYAVVSKGYRAGGYNIQMFSDIMQVELEANSSQRGDYDVPHTKADYDRIAHSIAYKPETSWNYEVGAHANLFGGSVQADLSAFFMRIRNQQLSVMASRYGFGRTMTNAGKSNSCGVEVALRGSALADRLAWTASYGYTRAVFKEYKDSVSAAGAVAVTDYEGRRVPFVPEHTVAASANYTLPVASPWLHGVTVGADVSGQGKTYWDEANTKSQRFYAVVGAHLAFDMGRVEVDLWGRNLTNNRHQVFAVNSGATGSNLWFAQRANPIQVGVDLKWKL